MHFKVVFFGILLSHVVAKRGFDESDRQMSREGREEMKYKKREGLDFLKRAAKGVRNLGEAIDPDAVARAERAWQEYSPNWRQTEEEMLRVREEMQAVEEEMEGVLSDIGNNAMSRNRQAEKPDVDLSDRRAKERKRVKRDAATMLKDTSNEIVGNIASEAVATFRKKLDEVLSEGNVRTAFKLWQDMLEIPGVQLFVKDPRLWQGAKRSLQKYLNGLMTEETRKDVQRAVNATAGFALHYALDVALVMPTPLWFNLNTRVPAARLTVDGPSGRGLSRNVEKTELEVFLEISESMCHLQGAAEKLRPLIKQALPMLGYKAYVYEADGAIKARLPARATLMISASSLLGMNPGSDPFLMTLIAAFVLGHISEDFAENLANLLVKTFTDSSTFERQSMPNGKRRRSVDPGKLATELVSGTSSCQELGLDAFEFFKGVKRALTSSEEGDPDGRALSADTSASTEDRLHPARKLGKDGRLFRLALWVAAFVDHPVFALDIFLMGVGIFILIGGMVLGASCREGIWGVGRGKGARKKMA